MELCIVENNSLYHTPDAQKNEHNGNEEEFVVDMMEIRPELLWCDVLLNFLHLNNGPCSAACVHDMCIIHYQICGMHTTTMAPLKLY